MSWKPSNPRLHSEGFEFKGLDRRFAEACERLNVIARSETAIGYAGQSRGAIVEAEDGSRYWLKLYGTQTANHPRRLSEIESDRIVGVPKPRLIRQTEWWGENTLWTARLMTLAMPTVAARPWAGQTAMELSDDWFGELRAALASLADQPCSRNHISRATVRIWLARSYNIHYRFPQDAWQTSHNDLHWSNLTAPVLNVLDWEWLGRSPIGFDASMLIAYSCLYDPLVERLERTFADQFQGTTGWVARLYAAHITRQAAQQGWLNPVLIPKLDVMIEKAALEIRKRTKRSRFWHPGRVVTLGIAILEKLKRRVVRRPT